MPKKPAKTAPKKPVGRPSKWSPEFSLAVCKLIEQIGWPGIAAEKLGVHRTTLYRWRDENPDFALDLAQARSVYISRVIKKVNNPQWLLERLDPESFGSKDATTVVNVTQTQVLSREDALKELRELAKSDPDVAKLLAAQETE